MKDATEKYLESIELHEDFAWTVEAISREIISGILNNLLRPHEVMYLAQKLQNKAKNQLKEIEAWKKTEAEIRENPKVGKSHFETQIPSGMVFKGEEDA